MIPHPWLSAALDLVMPRVCVACEALLAQRDSGIICGLCWSRVATLPQPTCNRCGHPVTETECSWCRMLPAFVRAARSYCWYPGPAATPIVSALKYSGWRVAAEGIAARMSRLSFPADVQEECSLLVPVPLSTVRERERGYNQSALLAVALARRWGLSVMVDCLRRSRATASQTKLTPEERVLNVAGAFSVRATAASTLQGAHVLLVDDVVTTAATLNECASALFAGGARIISYVTFGRARGPGDII